MKRFMTLLAALTLVGCGGKEHEITLAKQFVCTVTPTDPSETPLVSGMKLEYNLYIFSDNSVLVNCVDARPGGNDKSAQYLYAAWSPNANEGHCELPDTIDTYEGGKWYFATAVEFDYHEVKATYMDINSKYDGASWWMSCVDVNYQNNPEATK